MLSPPRFTHPDFSAKEVLQLQNLAAIDRPAEELPEQLSHEIQKSVAADMYKLGKKLGSGIELSRQSIKVPHGG